jgi:DNA topoisomerase-3
MVAEKPSICTSVAEALNQLAGNKNRLVSRNRSPPVYEFEGTFRGRSATIKVTSVTGHVFSLDFPSKYQSWETVDPMDLFHAPTIHTSDKGGIQKHLEREARGADALVLWMDCDREGENICFEVIRCVKNSMKSIDRNNIFRAKFSAVTVRDIERAMQTLVEPNENEAKSVDARQELDLKVGVAFSRFQTRYFQGKYGNLDSAVISYGPCQTPTLGFCVQRHDEIQSFISEPFWYLDLQVEVKGKRAPLKWDQGRLFDHGIVESLASVVSSNNELLCVDVKTSEVRRMRPQPLNTVELLKLASKHLGIGPHAAMRSAEHLYLSGLISYPRTESTAYPKSFDIREVLNTQKNHPEWGDYAKTLLQSGHSVPRQGHDAGDHPPITPVGISADLSGDNQRIYDLVSRHFLATISSDAIYAQTKAKFRSLSGFESFRITSRREVNPGFLAVYHQSSVSKEENAIVGDDDGDDDDEFVDSQNVAVEFEKGKTYKIHHLKVGQGNTTAPGYLTEAELIGMMEKHGIGTDASIPTHINNIMTRNYVTLGQGRTLIPTELGIVLVHGYLRIDPDLVLPEVRAAIESFCNLIAKGFASKEHVSLCS